MITVKQEEKLLDRIKALSELEFSSFLSELSVHIRKNNWGHIIDEYFEIETFEAENNELQEELEDMTKEKDDMADALSEISDLCDEADEFDDDLYDVIEKIKKLV